MYSSSHIDYCALQWSRLGSLRPLCQEVLKDKALPSDNSKLKNSGGNVGSVHSYSNGDSSRVVQLVNTATEADLSAVKHISSNVASSIVSYRSANGPFDRVTDLLTVPGIGQRTLQRLCEGILKPALQVDVGKGSRSSAGGEQVGVAPSRIEVNLLLLNCPFGYDPW